MEHPDAHTPAVSIIVPVTGDPAQALRCFHGLAAQSGAVEHEVIVVDDCSTGLEELMGRLAGDVEIVRSRTRRGLAGAVSLGLERARAELIVVIRDSAVPGPGWLEPLVGALSAPSVGMATSVSDNGHPVSAWSLAVRAADIRRVGLPEIGDELLVAALAVGLSGRRLSTVPVPASRIEAPGAPGALTGTATAPGTPPELTIVIPTLEVTGERVRRCVASIHAHTEAAHEIVLVDNSSPPQGFSAPVNAGLRASHAPYVVVVNDDVEVLAGWWRPLRAALDEGVAVVFPHTIDGPMRHDFAAWCFAMRRDALSEFAHAPGEFFDPELVIWYQDTDLLHRLRGAGRPPVLVQASQIRHGLSKTVGSRDPQLSGWIRAQVAVDRERFLAKHPDAILHGHALAA